MQNMDQWTMRQSSLELQLMIKQSTNNVSVICLFWVFLKKKQHNRGISVIRHIRLFLICFPLGTLLSLGEHSQGHYRGVPEIS